MRFSDCVKAARLKKGWTQAEFAKKSGVPQSTISAIETGIRNPTFETIRMIAKGLDCSVDELMADDQNEKKSADDCGGLRESVVSLLLDLPQEDLRQIHDYVSWLKSHHEGQ